MVEDFLLKSNLSLLNSGSPTYLHPPTASFSAIDLSITLITPLQCGFRKQRSTTDHLVRLESFIREAFIQRQHADAVFFDLEKAYDCTWKYGIVKDLHQAGLHRRLPCFIEGFLKNTVFSPLRRLPIRTV